MFVYKIFWLNRTRGSKDVKTLIPTTLLTLTLTFYSYIYDNYNNLSEYTLFLQGNPFDHYPEILDKIQEVTKMEKPPSFSFFAIYISDIL